MKEKLLRTIRKYENDDVFTPLEKYAVIEIKKTFETGSISNEERKLITDYFLSNYLIFDEISGEPIGETKEIEKLIDFVLYN